MNDILGFVNRENEETLETRRNFAPHDIYDCVKDTFSKQIISSERKDAIKTALEYLAEEGLIERVYYTRCSTKHYSVTGAEDLVRIEKLL